MPWQKVWDRSTRKPAIFADLVSEDFVMDTSAADEPPIDMDTILQPVKDSEAEMDIDVDGRPRFAPARDIVCQAHAIGVAFMLIIVLRTL
jgi:hypothetical protein